MTYFPQVAITGSDTAVIDPFDRLRVSNPYVLWDGKNLFAENTLLWDNQTTSGAASSSYDANTSSTTLALSTQTGTRVRQTKQRFNYMSGLSQLIYISTVLGAAVADVTRRVGYFDDQNGLFFEQTNTAVSVVKRSYATGSVVDVPVAQASWNIDKMDGTGISGHTVDFSKIQVLVIDFGGFGSGRVRFGFLLNGIIHYCHEMICGNAGTSVGMTTPNLPIRYELSSSADATATLVCVASSVLSEGGELAAGIQYSIDRDGTVFTTGNNTSRYPILSYRLKTTHKGARINVIGVNLLVTSSADFLWTLELNPTIAGTALSYADVTNTAIQAALGTTNATTVSAAGFVIASGYGTSTTKGVSLQPTALPREVPGFTIAGVSDEISLCIQNLSAGANTYYAALLLNEVV